MARKKKKLYRCRDASYDGCPDDVEAEGGQCEHCSNHWQDMLDTVEHDPRIREKLDAYNEWLRENGYRVLTAAEKM